MRFRHTYFASKIKSIAPPQSNLQGHDYTFSCQPSKSATAAEVVAEVTPRVPGIQDVIEIVIDSSLENFIPCSL